MSQQFGLGRGLSSLIPNKQQSNQNSSNVLDIDTDDDKAIFKKETRAITLKEDVIRGDQYIIEVDVNQVVPNPHQPRNIFDDEKMDNLMQSIKTHGIIQPLVVTKKGNQYELIAGERRFQASKKIGLKKVPVIVREASEKDKLELAIIENIQRHDLNAIEEARAYQKLSDEYQMNQDEVALKMGKSRSVIANKLRLLTLPVEIQKGLIDGKITEGHAKAILSISNPEKQRAFFDLILKSNFTVRQAEEKSKEISVKSHNRHINIDPEIMNLENVLVEKLGTKVKVSKAGNGGKIIIEYYSKEDLDSFLSKIS